jgi:hypothetical protein
VLVISDLAKTEVAAAIITAGRHDNMAELQQCLWEISAKKADVGG